MFFSVSSKCKDDRRAIGESDRQLIVDDNDNDNDSDDDNVSNNVDFGNGDADDERSCGRRRRRGGRWLVHTGHRRLCDRLARIARSRRRRWFVLVSLSNAHCLIFVCHVIDVGSLVSERFGGCVACRSVCIDSSDNVVVNDNCNVDRDIDIDIGGSDGDVVLRGAECERHAREGAAISHFARNLHPFFFSTFFFF
jgi:hypothetical protein